MKIQALRTLIAIAEIGSFARAAEQMHMTLSTVSMQIKSLERELDVILFDRLFRPPKLTPIGRKLVSQARRVIREHDELMILCSSGNGLCGDFRIGLVFTANVRMLPRFLANSRRIAPYARFEVLTGLSGELEKKVACGLIDMALVTRTEVDHPALEYRSMAFEEIVYAVPKAYTETPVEECMRIIPFLQFMPNTGIGALIASHLTSQNLIPREKMVMDDVEAIVECINEGIGFTALPKPDIVRYANRDVSMRPLTVPPFCRELALVVSRDSQVFQQIDALSVLCQESLQT